MAARRLLAGGEGFELAAEGAVLVLSGDLDGAAAERVLRAIEAEEGGGEISFELAEAELTDGAAVARMVDAVRALLARFERVRLVRAPQTLAHTLYRAGMLREGGALALVEPREEEGRAN